MKTKRKITKQEFAKMCGTSRPTLNKWIEQDKDGIGRYVTADGIDESIFKVEPWASMRKKPQQTNEREDLRAALADRDAQIAELKTEVAILNERVKGLETLNAMQADELQRMTQLADQAQRLHLAQLTALPAPRRTFRQWWEDVTGKHRPSQENDGEL